MKLKAGAPMSDKQIEGIRQRVARRDFLLGRSGKACVRDRAALLVEVDRCRAILERLGALAVAEAERSIKRDALRR